MLHVTTRAIVRMLPFVAMQPKPRVLATSLVLILLVAHCEPADEGRPPVTPQPAAAYALPPTDPPPEEGNVAYAPEEYVVGENAEAYDDDDPSALTDFRTSLDPYGGWSDDPTYGTVWVPKPDVVGADFRPYVSAGHWTYDNDWTWVSEYPWGWAPFHYGRWVWAGGHGWSWIPGRVYRGAWVTFSVDDGYGYLGWAPAPPAFLWRGGAPVAWRGGWEARWAYCPRGSVFAPSVGAHLVAAAAVAPVASRMHPYVPATPGIAGGPPPQRLGYQAAQLPRPTPVEAAHIARAQQFAQASSAQALGARAPTPTRPTSVAPNAVMTASPRHPAPDGPAPAAPNRGPGPPAGPPAAGPPAVPLTPLPGSRAPVTAVPTVHAAPHPSPPAVRSAPTFNGGGSFHGASPGAGGGGGGRHR